MFICPAVVGAGKRFFLDRVRLTLELVDEHRSATAWSFCRTLSVADRSEGGSYKPLVAISFKHPENYCCFCVHGTRHAEVVWFSCTVPDATPSSAVSGRRHYRDSWWLAFVAWTIHSTRRLHSFWRDGCCLLQVPRTAGILAAAERRGRRGALLLHFSISREHGWRAMEL
jgi:hypothetical protein